MSRSDRFGCQIYALFLQTKDWIKSQGFRGNVWVLGDTPCKARLLKERNRLDNDHGGKAPFCHHFALTFFCTQTVILSLYDILIITVIDSVILVMTSFAH